MAGKTFKKAVHGKGYYRERNIHKEWLVYIYLKRVYTKGNMKGGLEGLYGIHFEKVTYIGEYIYVGDTI